MNAPSFAFGAGEWPSRPTAKRPHQSFCYSDFSGQFYILFFEKHSLGIFIYISLPHCKPYMPLSDSSDNPSMRRLGRPLAGGVVEVGRAARVLGHRGHLAVHRPVYARDALAAVLDQVAGGANRLQGLSPACRVGAAVSWAPASL
jgi:hypothetical protein